MMACAGFKGPAPMKSSGQIQSTSGARRGRGRGRTRPRGARGGQARGRGQRGRQSRAGGGSQPRGGAARRGRRGGRRVPGLAPVDAECVAHLQQQRPDNIEVIFGPMFSGKTTELMRRVKRYQLANYSCLVVKYSKDDRYDMDGIATHDRQVLQATATTALHSLFSKAQEFDVIGVDEGQFFPDVVDFCEKMANQGKTVIVAALDGTFQRQGFGGILQLVPLAESVIKLNAVCMQCYGEASFTKRKGLEMAVEVIGGAEKYLAVCRACHKSPGKVSPMCSPSSKVQSRAQVDSGKLNGAGRRLFATELNNTMELS